MSESEDNYEQGSEQNGKNNSSWTQDTQTNKKEKKLHKPFPSDNSIMKTGKKSLNVTNQELDSAKRNTDKLDDIIEVLNNDQSSPSERGSPSDYFQQTNSPTTYSNNYPPNDEHSPTQPKKLTEIIKALQSRKNNGDDEWDDDDDNGYIIISVGEDEFWDLEEEAADNFILKKGAASMGSEMSYHASPQGKQTSDDEPLDDFAELENSLNDTSNPTLFSKAPADSNLNDPFSVNTAETVANNSIGPASKDPNGLTSTGVSPSLPDTPSEGNEKYALSQSFSEAEFHTPLSSPMPSRKENGSSQKRDRLDNDLAGLVRVEEALYEDEEQGSPVPTSNSQEGTEKRLVDPEISAIGKGAFGVPLAPSGPEDHYDQQGRPVAPKDSRPKHMSVGEQRRSEIIGQHRFQGVDGMHCSFNLKIIFEPFKTGFEETKDLQHPKGTILAGRYEVVDVLGQAAFSTALQCADLIAEEDEAQWVCLKVIKNNKDFFDQSLDEIKLLQYINSHGDPDDHHFLRLIDFFYCKEHLIIVSELLKENLYEFGRFIKENNQEPYYTMPRLKRIMKQVLEALVYIHSLNLIHCDIKPENIVIRSFSRCEVKLIDFGSSCFTTDHLTTYIQSRSYRAPEVIIGYKYDTAIDIWSVGAVLAELHTGYVLFQNDSVPTMLSRITGILGPFPKHVLRKGKETGKYFTIGNIVYEKDDSGDYQLIFPKRTTLDSRLHVPRKKYKKWLKYGNNIPHSDKPNKYQKTRQEELFVDFVRLLLHLDPKQRLRAEEALEHPWMKDADTVYVEEYIVGQLARPDEDSSDEEPEETEFPQAMSSVLQKGLHHLPSNQHMIKKSVLESKPSGDSTDNYNSNFGNNSTYLIDCEDEGEDDFVAAWRQDPRYLDLVAEMTSGMPEEDPEQLVYDDEDDDDDDAAGNDFSILEPEISES